MSVVVLARWDGVHTSFMPRVAAAQATSGEVASFYSTVILDSFPGVGGARWVEPAVLPHKRAQHQLVAVNQEDEEATHGERWP